jgi:hypothetical protein
MLYLKPAVRRLHPAAIAGALSVVVEGVRMEQGDLLLGFNARVTGPDSAWDERRKREFLFRLDAVRPLSIDAQVWPSAFDRFCVPRPDWVGIFDPLWETLAGLRQAVDAAGMPPGSACLAAFARVTAVCTPDERKTLETQLRGIHPDGTPGELPESISIPDTVEPGWAFLGYDVADLGGLSGLMNCGFGPDEDVEALRFHWGPKLNRWHLFDRLEDARKFKELSNQRVQEHAPFYVDGIWLVDGTINPSTGPAIPRTGPAV